MPAPEPQAVDETITEPQPPAAPPPPPARIENRAKEERKPEADLFKEQVQQLKQGLVGGVRPLPVTIPESGKLLLLTGALPPEHIAVELEVKGKK